MAQNLTHYFNRLFIYGVEEDAIESYQYTINADSLGMQLDVDLVINQGNDMSAFEPDNIITVILHGVRRKFLVTDTTKSISGTDAYSFNMTLLEPVHLKSEYVTARPIAYMSKSNEEATNFMSSDVLFSLDYDVRLKTYHSESSRRKGWKLSEVAHDIGKALEIPIHWSGSINPYIGEFKIEGSFYEALVSLTKKHGLRPVYIPNLTADTGRIVVVDALGGRGYASGFARIRGANEMSESKTSLPFPSYVEVIGGQETVNPLTYSGESTPFKKIRKADTSFGTIREYVPARDKDSDGNDVFDTADAELSVATLGLKGWASGYLVNAGEDAVPYGYTNDYSTDFKYYEPAYFGLDNIETSQPQNESAELKLLGRVKTIEEKAFSYNFFCEPGPIIHSHTLTYVEALTGDVPAPTEENPFPTAPLYELNTLADLSPRFVISYVEEAFNYGNSVNFVYETPRYYSPIVRESEGGTFFVTTEENDTVIADAVAILLQRYGGAQSPFTVRPLMELTDGSHIPYNIKLEYGRLPIPNNPAEGSETSKVSQTKLVPIRVTMQFIRYAHWTETAYTPGAVICSANVVFEVVGRDADGKKISMAAKSTTEEGDKYTLIPEAWNDYNSAQPWIALIQEDCIVSLETTRYLPTGDSKSYQQDTYAMILEDGILKVKPNSQVVFGSIPHAELKKRKEDIVEREEIVPAYEQVWISMGDDALNLYKYTKAPLIIHDPSLISRHDAKTIARRFKYYYNAPVIKRTYTFDGVIPLSIGWGTVFEDIYGPQVPFQHTTSIGAPGASRLMEGSGRVAMVTNVMVSRDANGGRTVVEAETLNIN